VYALGVTLYELLTLRPAYSNESMEAIRRAILDGSRIPIRNLNRSVPRDVETVANAAMDVSLDRRYATAGAFARDLENLLTLNPIDASPPSAWMRARAYTARRPSLTTGAVIVALGLAAGGGWRAWKLAADSGRVSALLTEARGLRDEGNFARALEVAGAALGIDPRHADALALRDALRQGFADRARQNQRLADAGALGLLLTEVDALWPLTPALAPALRAWLERAATVGGRAAVHRADAAELRARARLAEESRLPELTEARELVLLTEISDALESLDAASAEVRARLAFVSTLEERTVSGGEARALWSRALDDLRELDVYRGLGLTPQAGLLPLRRDPRSGLWEFLLVQTGREPRVNPLTDEYEWTGDTGIVLVLIPAGSFRMGSYAVSERRPAGSELADPNHRLNEEPVVKIALSAFFLAKCELTVGQWRRLGNLEVHATWSQASFAIPAASNRPMTRISWHDGKRALERVGCTLPTEAQWEYACRAGTTSVYSCGQEVASLQGYANIADRTLENSSSPPDSRYESVLSDGYKYDAPVASFRPNAFGLYDMHGNLWEWCQEAGGGPRIEPWTASALASPRQLDGYREFPEKAQRICRGGGFGSMGLLARSACRSDQRSDARDIDKGIRPCRTIRY
jgi:formylglycine-generating enzyme required for sulfatase activity